MLAAGITAVSALAIASKAGNSPRSGALHVTKECSEYSGAAFSFCTITSSSVNALTVGSKVVYLQAPGASSLDSDIVIVVGPGKFARPRHARFRNRNRRDHDLGWDRPVYVVHAKADVTYLGGTDWAWDRRCPLG